MQRYFHYLYNDIKGSKLNIAFDEDFCLKMKWNPWECFHFKGARHFVFWFDLVIMEKSRSNLEEERSDF